jgi:hypothetical protein
MLDCGMFFPNPVFSYQKYHRVNNSTSKDGSFIPNLKGLRPLAGLRQPVSPTADAIVGEGFLLGAEDFMQRRILLCSNIFSMGQVLRAVSPLGGVPYKY